MFDEIPQLYKNQTANSEEEGWKYTQGDRAARRPPELLTRDHVARCIVREIKEGRGSPHNGVFLDISWIKKKLPNAADHIRRKLPSMYNQFKKLADIDITREAMEVGPTTHYMMGGIRVDADTQMSTVPGLFSAGESAAGLHGANRLGGNSLSDLLVFGKRAGEFAAKFARESRPGVIDDQEIARVAGKVLEPFERTEGDNPFQVQYDLQEMMQNLVGIVRREEELLNAMQELEKLRIRSNKVKVIGNREYNNGWHTALDLQNLLTVSEAITLSAIERKESRGAHFREDYPEKDENSGKFNLIIFKGENGKMQVKREPRSEIRTDLKQIIEEMK